MKKNFVKLDQESTEDYDKYIRIEYNKQEEIQI